MSLLLLFNQGAAASVVSGAGAIAGAEAFGVAQLNFKVFPSAVSSIENFGIATTRFAIAPPSISSAEAFGTSSVGFRLAPSAIASLEAWGSARLSLRIFVGGLTAAETFGAPAVLQASPQTIGAFAIAGAETFGAAFIGDPPREQFFPPLAQGVSKADRLPRLIPATPRPRRLGAMGIPGAEVFGEPGLSISREPQLLAAIALQPHARAGTPAFARAPSARQLRDEQEILFDLAA